MKKALFTISAFICFCAAICASAGAFSDVKAGEWYEPNIIEMTERGLLEGYEDGTFRPNEPITAAQFVAIVSRCAGISRGADYGGHWARGYLDAAMQRGWYDWDEIPPDGKSCDRPIKRELAVKILMKALLPAERGDYNTESVKMRDFGSLNGRYYEAVLAAYSCKVAQGDENGNFNPQSGLSRAEACALIMRAVKKSGSAAENNGTSEKEVPKPVSAVRGGVSENGRLQVKNAVLCNELGEPVILSGMSSHGIQWYGQFACEQAIKNTAAYGANVFRVAMYTEEGGYLSRPAEIYSKVTDAVDAAIKNDMYVIVDWHILSNGNPMDSADRALSFFADIAERYKDSPAVIYEICNEPNGAVSWEGDIKPYAEKAVAVIREKSPDSVILIGGGTWSQDIHIAAQDPLEGENLMYTLHFYAGTHGAELRERIDYAMGKGLAVFVSEWGTSRADGGGGVFLKESAEWLDFLDERGISRCNWSLCDKNEASAALRPGTSAQSVWSESDLSESGKFVFSRF